MPDPSTSQAAAQTAGRCGKRPLSPHLQIYRPQLTSAMSIFHRVTGVSLAPALAIVVAWLAALATGGKCYEGFLWAATSPIGQLCLFGWTFAGFYHMCCGVRHLLWDAGWCVEIHQVYSTGRVALPVAAISTLGVWFIIKYSAIMGALQ